MTTVVRASLYALTALALVVAVSACVLDLTWAPVHDAPNEFHFHADATPTATSTAGAEREQLGASSWAAPRRCARSSRPPEGRG
jgi:hypothetical protein